MATPFAKWGKPGAPVVPSRFCSPWTKKGNKSQRDDWFVGCDEVLQRAVATANGALLEELAREKRAPDAESADLLREGAKPGDEHVL